VTDALVVASFNLRNGLAFDGRNSWLFRRRATAEVVRSLDADVLGLQEAYRFQLRSLLRRVPRYTAVGEGRNGGRRGERTPVLVRGPVESQVTRWFDVTGARFPRIATTARLTIGATKLSITSTHLDESSPERRAASVEQLAAWLAGEPGPHIVVGDFNATLDDPMFGAFAAIGLRSALPHDAGATTNHFGRGEGRQIDHIFVPSDAEVFDASVVHLRPRGHYASDHWPVRARVRL
jgi:endonuclease/exonuclease/phosphatase family metal-dependent hydrolase